MQSVELGEILAFLEGLAPPALAESWDNVGLLVEGQRDVSGVLTALDITPAIVAEALEKDCQLIVAHHPVIFAPLKRLGVQEVAWQLTRLNISAICMHTNLDCADGGTGDTLAALLGLTHIAPFAVQGNAKLGRLGSLPAPLTMPQLAALCEKVLHTGVRYTPAKGLVQRVAVVTGAGDDWADALAAGADALVTGEVGYHHALDAAAAGIGLVAAGHYATEAPIAAVLAKKLAAAFPTLHVHPSEKMRDVFCELARKGDL